MKVVSSRGRAASDPCLRHRGRRRAVSWRKKLPRVACLRHLRCVGSSSPPRRPLLGDRPEGGAAAHGGVASPWHPRRIGFASPPRKPLPGDRPEGGAAVHGDVASPWHPRRAGFAPPPRRPPSCRRSEGEAAVCRGGAGLSHPRCAIGCGASPFGSRTADRGHPEEEEDAAAACRVSPTLMMFLCECQENGRVSFSLLLFL